MRYQARIKQRIGPFASSALGCTHRLCAPSTRLTIACREPLPIAQLVSLLDRLGIEIEEIRRCGLGWKP